MTFAPFVKPIPAFLHNFIYVDFGADCSDYDVNFITHLCAKQERSRESVDGHKQSIHAHEHKFSRVPIASKGATKHYANV